jgi:hypothetical protein
MRVIEDVIVARRRCPQGHGITAVRSEVLTTVNVKESAASVLRVEELKMESEGFYETSILI